MEFSPGKTVPKSSQKAVVTTLNIFATDVPLAYLAGPVTNNFTTLWGFWAF